MSDYTPEYAAIPRFKSVVVLVQMPDKTYIGAYSAKIPDFTKPTHAAAVAELIHAVAKEEIHCGRAKTMIRSWINGGNAARGHTTSTVMNQLWGDHHMWAPYEPFEEVAKGFYLFKDGGWHSITEDIPHPHDWFKHYQWPKFIPMGD